MSEDGCRARRQARSHVFIGKSAPLCHRDVPDGAVGGEQIDHPQVAVHDGYKNSVGGTFDLGIRISAMLQQKLRDLVVSVVYGRIKRVAVRRDAFFGKIRIGAMIEEQFDDLDVSAGGGVFERSSAAKGTRA